MIEYIKTTEILTGTDAIDALDGMRRDLHGLAALLHSVDESPSEPDPMVLALAHDVALTICGAADSVFPIAGAALTACNTCGKAPQAGPEPRISSQPAR